MKLPYSILVFAGQTSSCSVFRHPKEPPVPFHVPDEKRKVPDSYGVSLKRGYSLDDHLCQIGVDLRTAAQHFSYLDSIDWYHFTMPNASAVLNKIRFDTDVVIVEQESYLLSVGRCYLDLVGNSR